MAQARPPPASRCGSRASPRDDWLVPARKEVAMVLPVRLDPGEALHELVEAQHKLVGAVGRFGRIRDAHVEIATTPKEEVLRIDKTALYHYAPPAGTSIGGPILILYALVGRYTVIDLQEDRAFGRRLLGARLDIYAPDWGHPPRADRSTA